MTEFSPSTPLSPPPAPTVPPTEAAMPYVPSPEKLKALGFDKGTHLDSGLDYRRYWWGPEFTHTEHRITVDGGELELRYDDSNAEERVVFVGQAPSEVFFDQLLIAVGWQPGP